MAPVILMYNLDTPRGSRLRLVCLKLRVRVRAVKPEEYALPVGALAGVLPMPKELPAPKEGFSDEMLVMANFDGALLNRFLGQIRAEKIPGVALKAVLTPSNAQWDSVTLRGELAKEHEAMRYGRGGAHAEGKKP